FFFFSSRRRHTSFSRDWSSDVCSSDLRQDREKEKKAGPSGEGRKPGRLILSRNKADFLRSPLFCMKKIFCLHTNPGKQLPAGRAADWLKWRKSGFSKAGGKNSA